MSHRTSRAFRHPLVFGSAGSGHVYRPRRAAYLIARDERGRLACERGRRGGLYLIGGGLEPDERPEDALHREVREEAAANVRDARFLGILREWFVAPDGRSAHDQAAYFWSGRLSAQAADVPAGFEWAPRDRFEAEAVYGSHVYAATHLGPPRAAE